MLGWQRARAHLIAGGIAGAALLSLLASWTVGTWDPALTLYGLALNCFFARPVVPADPMGSAPIDEPTLLSCLGEYSCRPR